MGHFPHYVTKLGWAPGIRNFGEHSAYLDPYCCINSHDSKKHHPFRISHDISAGAFAERVWRMCGFWFRFRAATCSRLPVATFAKFEYDFDCAEIGSYLADPDSHYKDRLRRRNQLQSIAERERATLGVPTHDSNTQPLFDTWLYCHTEEENRLYNTTNSNPQPTTCTAIGGGGDDDSGDNGAAAIADSIIDGIISYAVDSRDPAYWLDPANWIDPAPAYANPDYAAARAKASARVMVNLRSSSRSPCDVPAAAPAPAAAHNPGISHDSMEPWWSEVHAAAH